MDTWYPVQVKQKDKVGRPDIDSFEAMMARSGRTKGFFVSFDYSRDALTEIDAFFRKSGRVIIALTVREILDEEIARKLAIKFTGIVCPSCREPVARIEYEAPTSMTFHCPACGNRWSAEPPGALKH